MEMLLRWVNQHDLAGMLSRHEEASPAPHLLDPATVTAAREAARRLGVWERLDGLDPAREIPVIRRSAYRNYRRCGDRTLHQGKANARMTELRAASLALWLDHPKADVDYLQDLLWAYCDEHTWVMAAHEGCRIDLGSAMLGAALAEVVHVLGDRLEEEVTARVRAEIQRRIFDLYWSVDETDGWQTNRMNWNHVCNGEIVRAALYLERGATRLAHLIHKPLQDMTYALDGFAKDGGCLEGYGYWGYGFGHYLMTAHAVLCRTGGELNLVSAEEVKAVCRYPLAVFIEAPLVATYGDGGHGYMQVMASLLINQFLELPELYANCEPRQERMLKLETWHDLALGHAVRVPSASPKRDAVLPELGLAMLRGKPGDDQLTLATLAGRNDFPHNHLDIGSFMVHRGGQIWLVDPLGPQYRAKTFGPDRYEIVYCNCLGHSVPMIDGHGQQPGGQYEGRLTVDGLDGDGVKSATLDLGKAYPDGLFESFERHFDLDAASNVLTLTDSFTFDGAPKQVEEAFVTFTQIEVEVDGVSVRIGPAGEGVVLTALQPGSFRVEDLTEACREDWHKPEQAVKRIVFVPAATAAALVLRFEVRASVA